MNTIEVYFNIIDGPPKDVVWDMGKYAYEKGAVIPNKFKTSPGYVMPQDKNATSKKQLCEHKIPDFGKMRIKSVGHENGSGFSLNFTGYCGVYGDDNDEVPFTATYNSHCRKGVIRIPMDKLR